MRTALINFLLVVRGRSKKVALRHTENVLYRMCGLPIVLRSLFGRPGGDSDKSIINRAYVSAFWSPETADQWLDVALAAALFPMAVFAAALWYTFKNGSVVAGRSGRAAALQFVDQMLCAGTTGILPPWYYVFELFLAKNRSNAPDYLSRAETKQCVYPMLNSTAGSQMLGDKAAFAASCRECGLPTPSVILVSRKGMIEWSAEQSLPEQDLFIKPVNGRGGAGAERWDFCGGHYRNGAGVALNRAQLIEKIRLRSRICPLLVQPRLENHFALDGFGTGALTTVRVLTCLDEHYQPETIAAVFRMAVGSNRTVDNLHAGGIAAAVDLQSGCLGRASNLGMDAHLGWVDRHPDTGRAIEGEILPMWAQVLDLARRAHLAFEKITIAGWDIGIVATGPILIEGNYGPDVDIMQRQSGMPQGRGRFAQLIAYHLREKMCAMIC